MSTLPIADVEDLATALYCALDDALAEAQIECRDGKLIPRRGPPPEVDDREVLCLALLQELLHFESDNRFFHWLEDKPVVQRLFPRRFSRQKFAERRALLMPLMQRLCQAFCALGGEGAPPFSSLIRPQYMSANSSGSVTRSGWADWRPPAIALR